MSDETNIHHGLVPEASRVKRSINTKEERDNPKEGSLLRRVPRNIGRPKRYTPTKFRNRINDYFATCEKKQCYPNIKGMMLHLGMSKDQFYQYDKYPEMKPIVEWARTVMEDWSMNDLWHTATSNTNKQLVAKVNHGWAEEKQITHINMDKGTALAKLEALAPLLLEMLKSQMNLEQLLIPKLEDKSIQEAEYEILKESFEEVA
jgi:hypothetical protein